MKIAAGICVYIDDKNQLPEFARLLESVKTFPHVIVVDGKWTDFEGPSCRSINEVNELCMRYPNVMHVLVGCRPEHEARQFYLTQAAALDCDAILIIDSDEYLESYPDMLELTNEIGGIDMPNAFEVPLTGKRTGGEHWPPRLITHPELVMYGFKHNEVLYKNTNLLKQPLKRLKSIRIMEDRTYRSEYTTLRMVTRNNANPNH